MADEAIIAFRPPPDVEAPPPIRAGAFLFERMNAVTHRRGGLKR